METKGIVISIQPQWVALEINKIKKLEIRKKFCYKWALKQIKENGGFYIYIYATKKGSLTIYHSWSKTLAGYVKKYIKHNNNVAGSVIGRFWCTKVEELYSGEDGGYYTDSIQEDDKVEKLSCLDTGDIEEYLNGSIGYAIHIGDIELFDVSRDIKSFKHTKVYHKREECPYGNPCVTCFSCEQVVNLEKAPQSWCFVEVD